MVVPKTDYRAILIQLIQKKEGIEQELIRQTLVLKKYNVTETEPLIDRDGFPRDDINIYEVRTARHQIICLRNDLKQMMSEIEKNLHALHADKKADQGEADSPKMSGGPVRSDDDCSNYKPFVRVNKVFEGSPAHFSGLQLNDEIAAFGSVNATNFRGLDQIAQIAQNRKNETVVLKVIRNNEVIELNLIPRHWEGRGLLGCNIMLSDNVDR